MLKFLILVVLIISSCTPQIHQTPLNDETTPGSQPKEGDQSSQEPQQPTDPESKPEGEPVQFTLMPGDVISVMVVRHKEFDIQVTVNQDGTVNIPILKEINVRGKTPKDVQVLLEKALKAESIIKNPQVIVNVVSYAPRVAYVYGGVKATHDYPFPPSGRFTLLQAITKAGGPDDLANKEAVKILREGKVIEASLIAAESGKDILLQPDDIIVVPRGQNFIYVLGYVNKPGIYSLPSDRKEGIVYAITQSGDVAKFGSRKKVQLVRGTKVTIVNVEKILSGGEKDVELQSGDIILVPAGGLF